MWSYFFILLWDAQDGQVRTLTTKTRIRILTLEAKKKGYVWKMSLATGLKLCGKQQFLICSPGEPQRRGSSHKRRPQNLPVSSDVSRVDAFSLCRKPPKHCLPVWLHSARLLLHGGHDTKSTDRLVMWLWAGVLAVSTVERNDYIYTSHTWIVSTTSVWAAESWQEPFNKHTLFQ